VRALRGTTDLDCGRGTGREEGGGRGVPARRKRWPHDRPTRSPGCGGSRTRGGESTVENVRLLCQGHAEQVASERLERRTAGADKWGVHGLCGHFGIEEVGWPTCRRAARVGRRRCGRICLRGDARRRRGCGGTDGNDHRSRRGALVRHQLRHELARLVLGAVEEPGEHLRAVLRREDLRDLEDGGEVQRSVGFPRMRLRRAIDRFVLADARASCEPIRAETAPARGTVPAATSSLPFRSGGPSRPAPRSAPVARCSQ
jgi:hypothetical protein